MFVYREEWQHSYDFIKKDNTSRHKSYCSLCKKLFSISHGRLNDVKKHCTRSYHQSCEQNLKKNQTLQQFLNKDILTSKEEKIIAAEIVQVYHAVKHTILYRSLDCHAKLLFILFSDSKIAGKTIIGRTKAEGYCTQCVGTKFFRTPD